MKEKIKKIYPIAILLVVIGILLLSFSLTQASSKDPDLGMSHSSTLSNSQGSVISDGPHSFSIISNFLSLIFTWLKELQFPPQENEISALPRQAPNQSVTGETSRPSSSALISQSSDYVAPLEEEILILKQQIDGEKTKNELWQAMTEACYTYDKLVLTTNHVTRNENGEVTDIMEGFDLYIQNLKDRLAEAEILAKDQHILCDNASVEAILKYCTTANDHLWYHTHIVDFSLPFAVRAKVNRNLVWAGCVINYKTGENSIKNWYDDVSNLADSLKQRCQKVDLANVDREVALLENALSETTQQKEQVKVAKQKCDNLTIQYDALYIK